MSAPRGSARLNTFETDEVTGWMDMPSQPMKPDQPERQMSGWRMLWSHVRNGAPMRQNRVLILINGHNQSKVREFFLTDWIKENIYSLDRLNMATCELAAPRSL